MTTTVRETTLDDSGRHRTGTDTWSLSIVHHPVREHVGKRIVLEPDRPLVLGRESTLFGAGGLEDARVSRQHTRIAVSAGLVRVEDLSSRNGTYVNNRKLTTAITLKPNDVIRLGSILLLVHATPAEWTPYDHPQLIGRSHQLSRVLDQIDKLAPHRATVLILGETGTGKELVARAIHERSGRVGPFCALNCGGMPDTLLQSELFGHVRGAFSGADRDRIGLCQTASDGTLFLDEIGDASPSLQVSLLRFLQEGEVRRLGANDASKVNTRVVAATHRELLGGEVVFREDLYARLARGVIHLPPLRARIEDIPQLVEHFYTLHAGKPRELHWRLVYRLLRYSWPRNVRELQMFVERLAIETADLPEPIELPPVLEPLLDETEQPSPIHSAAQPTPPATPKARRARKPSADELQALLEQHGGNVTALATSLGVGRNTLYRWLKAAGIELDQFRDE